MPKVERRILFRHRDLWALLLGFSDEKLCLVTSNFEPEEVNAVAERPVELLAVDELCEYFDGKRREFTVPIEFSGTGFQMSVWKALLTIPFGETKSYGDIAKMIGRPKAVRAVGGACSKNPVWIIVPCHRVIGAGGTLTGFAGGFDMKECLLAHEKSFK